MAKYTNEAFRAEQALPDQTNCAHCWHNWAMLTGLNAPPPDVMLMMCCRCGSEGLLEGITVDAPVENHGEFIYQYSVVWENANTKYFRPSNGKRIAI
jgi:hypothetical protein